MLYSELRISLEAKKSLLSIHHLNGTICAKPRPPKDATIDFLLDERIRELVGEELRRFTLVRTGKLVERVKKYNPHSNTMDEHHTLWHL